MFGRFAHYRTATMLVMTRNIAPLPCCGCACSATRLLGRHPSRVFTTLLPQSRSGEQRPCCSHCVSRVACRLRARVVVVEPPTASWPKSARVYRGCWPGPTRVMLHPGRVVEHQSVSSCCAGRCVVVRRTRTVKCAAVTFCTVFSHSHIYIYIYINLHDFWALWRIKKNMEKSIV